MSSFPPPLAGSPDISPGKPELTTPKKPSSTGLEGNNPDSTTFGSKSVLHTSGNAAGVTADDTVADAAGGTAGDVAGDAAGDAAGDVAGDAAVATAVATAGNAADTTAGNVGGGAVGNTATDTAGNTAGITAGKSADSVTGNATDSTEGSITGSMPSIAPADSMPSSTSAGSVTGEAPVSPIANPPGKSPSLTIPDHLRPPPINVNIVTPAYKATPIVSASVPMPPKSNSGRLDEQQHVANTAGAGMGSGVGATAGAGSAGFGTNWPGSVTTGASSAAVIAAIVGPGIGTRPASAVAVVADFVDSAGAAVAAGGCRPGDAAGSVGGVSVGHADGGTSAGTGAADEKAGGRPGSAVGLGTPKSRLTTSASMRISSPEIMPTDTPANASSSMRGRRHSYSAYIHPLSTPTSSILSSPGVRRVQGRYVMQPSSPFGRSLPTPLGMSARSSAFTMSGGSSAPGSSPMSSRGLMPFGWRPAGSDDFLAALQHDSHMASEEVLVGGEADRTYFDELLDSPCNSPFFPDSLWGSNSVSPRPFQMLDEICEKQGQNIRKQLDGLGLDPEDIDNVLFCEKRYKRSSQTFQYVIEQLAKRLQEEKTDKDVLKTRIKELEVQVGKLSWQKMQLTQQLQQQVAKLPPRHEHSRHEHNHPPADPAVAAAMVAAAMAVSESPVAKAAGENGFSRVQTRVPPIPTAGLNLEDLQRAPSMQDWFAFMTPTGFKDTSPAGSNSPRMPLLSPAEVPSVQESRESSLGSREWSLSNPRVDQLNRATSNTSSDKSDTGSASRIFKAWPGHFGQMLTGQTLTRPWSVGESKGDTPSSAKSDSSVGSKSFRAWDSSALQQVTQQEELLEGKTDKRVSGCKNIVVQQCAGKLPVEQTIGQELVEEAQRMREQGLTQPGLGMPQGVSLQRPKMADQGNSQQPVAGMSQERVSGPSQLELARQQEVRRRELVMEQLLTQQRMLRLPRQLVPALTQQQLPGRTQQQMADWAQQQVAEMVVPCVNSSSGLPEESLRLATAGAVPHNEQGSFGSHRASSVSVTDDMSSQSLGGIGTDAEVTNSSRSAGEGGMSSDNCTGAMHAVSMSNAASVGSVSVKNALSSSAELAELTDGHVTEQLAGPFTNQFPWKPVQQLPVQQETPDTSVLGPAQQLQQVTAQLDQTRQARSEQDFAARLPQAAIMRMLDFDGSKAGGDRGGGAGLPGSSAQSQGLDGVPARAMDPMFVPVVPGAQMCAQTNMHAGQQQMLDRAAQQQTFDLADQQQMFDLAGQQHMFDPTGQQEMLDYAGQQQLFHQQQQMLALASQLQNGGLDLTGQQQAAQTFDQTGQQQPVGQRVDLAAQHQGIGQTSRDMFGRTAPLHPVNQRVGLAAHQQGSGQMLDSTGQQQGSGPTLDHAGQLSAEEPQKLELAHQHNLSAGTVQPRHADLVQARDQLAPAEQLGLTADGSNRLALAPQDYPTSGMPTQSGMTTQFDMPGQTGMPVQIVLPIETKLPSQVPVPNQTGIPAIVEHQPAAEYPASGLLPSASTANQHPAATGMRFGNSPQGQVDRCSITLGEEERSSSLLEQQQRVAGGMLQFMKGAEAAAATGARHQLFGPHAGNDDEASSSASGGWH